MKHKFLTALLLVLFLVGCGSPAASTTGVSTKAPEPQRLLTRKIPAPSLQNNMLGAETEQYLVVYLPPSYSTWDKRYPVIYFLPGYGYNVNAFASGVQGFDLPGSMDDLIAAGTVKEMILVIANGINRLGGSFYANSPVTGNWEDFIVHDMVSYVDQNYRTIPQAASRGIAGHSMGGNGAWNIAMKHPDVFGSVYMLSPGLFDENGLSDSQMFSNPANITAARQTFDALAKLSGQEAIAKLESTGGATILGFTIAYGAAFAPLDAPPFIDYPYRDTNGNLAQDPAAWERWVSGFGDQPGKVTQYKANLATLKGIGFEYGARDEYPYIPRGCIYLSKILDEAGIPHVLNNFDGGHQDKLGERMAKAMAPFFARVLDFGK